MVERNEIRLPSGNTITVEDMNNEINDRYRAGQEIPNGVKLLTTFGGAGLVSVVVGDQ